MVSARIRLSALEIQQSGKVKESIPFLNGAEAKLRTPFEVQVTVKKNSRSDIS